MQISEVMTQDLITLNSSVSIQEVASMMKKFNIGACPILEDNKLVGIITDRDIVVRMVAQNLPASESKVKNFMTPSPIYVPPNTDVHEAASIMGENQIRRLLVVSNGNLQGIVSLGDLAAQTKNEAERVLELVSKPIRKEVAA